MTQLLIILGIALVGALYWLWRTALDDAGLAVVATAVCAVFISVFSSTMVMAVMLVAARQGPDERRRLVRQPGRPQPDGDIIATALEGEEV